MTRHWSLRQVTVAFHTPFGVRTVLNNLTFNVDVAEWIAVVGANGSGKSTLAKVLAGLVGVSRGNISFDLTALAMASGTDSDAPHGGKNFTPFVFQNPDAQILGDRVEEDVHFGMECLGIPIRDVSDRDRVDAVLAEVGLAGRRHDLVRHLSGGQKQRLCIADAMALDQPGIIFDEATSMLDLASRKDILKVVQELHRKGRTIVWVTQSLEELAYATRVIALTDGSISYDGDVANFFYGGPGPESLGSGSGEITEIIGQMPPTPCERLGFSLPYIVSVVRDLQRQGISMPSRPLSVTELMEVLTA